MCELLYVAVGEITALKVLVRREIINVTFLRENLAHSRYSAN